MVGSYSHGSATSVPSTCRHFWWGRNNVRSNTIYSTAVYHKSLDSQQRVGKYKPARYPLPPLRFGSSFYYCRGQGWRLASSWGNPDERPSAPKSSDKGEPESELDRELKKEMLKWREEMNDYVERLRRKVEKYPYETLFGASIKNGVWNPWENHWNGWMRDVTKREWLGAKITGGTKSAEQCRYQAKPAWSQPEARSTQNGRSDPASSVPGSKASDEFDIDLITLRRIPKKLSEVERSAIKPDITGNYDIPVKLYKSSETTIYQKKEPNPKGSLSGKPVEDEGEGKAASVAEISPKGTDQKSWLTEEGFTDSQAKQNDSIANHESSKDAINLAPKKEPSKMESSLDRHLQNASSLRAGLEGLRSSLEYKVDENKTEDIDLLRASNIRASSGRVRKTVPETMEACEHRRAKLEYRFEENRKQLEDRYTAELANMVQTEDSSPEVETSKYQRVDRCSETMHQGVEDKQVGVPDLSEMATNHINSDDTSPTNVDAWGYDLAPKDLETSYQHELENKTQSLENYYANQQQQLIESRSSTEERKLKRDAADALLAKEIQSQKAAMAALEDKKNESSTVSFARVSHSAGEGDLSDNVHEYGHRSRWYKRKAPHALIQEQQKANDEELVREIRQIYEEKYGIIDTRHVQTRSNPSAEDRGDSAVQEGLRVYDEKIAADEHSVTTKGKLATTDLNEFEISRLGSASQSTEPAPLPVNTTVTGSESSRTGEQKFKKLGISLPKIDVEAKAIPRAQSYKVLALDPIIQQVVAATTTSSLFESSSPPRSVSAILSHLEQPARYFDHFEPLDAAGYELVAGSRSMLIFKKVRDENLVVTKAMQDTINNFLKTAETASSPLSIKQSTRTLRDVPIGPDITAVEDFKLPNPFGVQQSEYSISPSTVQANLSKLQPRAKATPTASNRSNSQAEASDKDVEQRNITTQDDYLSKMNQDGPPHDVLVKASQVDIVNPIDGTTASKTGLEYSVEVAERYCGTTLSKSTSPSTMQDANATNSASKSIRREEAVFSGRDYTKDLRREEKRQRRRLIQMTQGKTESRRTRRKIWRNTKRIISTGAWVAICFYLVGGLLEEIYRPQRSTEISDGKSKD